MGQVLRRKHQSLSPSPSLSQSRGQACPQVAVGAGDMCGMTGEDATYSITGCAGAGVTNSITGAGAAEESDGADVTSSISSAGVAWEIPVRSQRTRSLG